jgi:hypothetical protein
MFSTLLSISTLLVLGVSSVPVAHNAPPISLPIKGFVDTKGFRTIADADRARAAVLRSQALGKHAKRGGNPGVPVLNTAVTYTAAVQVGSPPVECKFLILFHGMRSISENVHYRYSDCRHRKLQHLGRRCEALRANR